MFYNIELVGNKGPLFLLRLASTSIRSIKKNEIIHFNTDEAFNLFRGEIMFSLRICGDCFNGMSNIIHRQTEYSRQDIIKIPANFDKKVNQICEILKQRYGIGSQSDESSQYEYGTFELSSDHFSSSSSKPPSRGDNSSLPPNFQSQDSTIELSSERLSLNLDQSAFPQRTESRSLDSMHNVERRRGPRTHDRSSIRGDSFDSDEFQNTLISYSDLPQGMDENIFDDFGGDDLINYEINYEPDNNLTLLEENLDRTNIQPVDTSNIMDEYDNLYGSNYDLSPNFDIVISPSRRSPGKRPLSEKKTSVPKQRKKRRRHYSSSISTDSKNEIQGVKNLRNRLVNVFQQPRLSYSSTSILSPPNYRSRKRIKRRRVKEPEQYPEDDLEDGEEVEERREERTNNQHVYLPGEEDRRSEFDVTRTDVLGDISFDFHDDIPRDQFQPEFDDYLPLSSSIQRFQTDRDDGIEREFSSHQGDVLAEGNDNGDAIFSQRKPSERYNSGDDYEDDYYFQQPDDNLVISDALRHQQSFFKPGSSGSSGSSSGISESNYESSDSSSYADISFDDFDCFTDKVPHRNSSVSKAIKIFSMLLNDFKYKLFQEVSFSEFNPIEIVRII